MHQSTHTYLIVVTDRYKILVAARRCWEEIFDEYLPECSPRMSVYDELSKNDSVFRTKFRIPPLIFLPTFSS